MAHRVSRRVEAFELDGLANLDHVACADAAIHVRDATFRVLACAMTAGAGGLDHAFVATCMIAVLMRVEYLRDRPPIPVRHRQALADNPADRSPALRHVSGQAIR